MTNCAGFRILELEKRPGGGYCGECGEEHTGAAAGEGAHTGDVR